MTVTFCHAITSPLLPTLATLIMPGTTALGMNFEKCHIPTAIFEKVFPSAAARR